MLAKIHFSTYLQFYREERCFSADPHKILSIISLFYLLVQFHSFLSRIFSFYLLVPRISSFILSSCTVPQFSVKSIFILSYCTVSQFSTQKALSGSHLMFSSWNFIPGKRGERNKIIFLISRKSVKPYFHEALRVTGK